MYISVYSIFESINKQEIIMTNFLMITCSIFLISFIQKLENISWWSFRLRKNKHHFFYLLNCNSFRGRFDCDILVKIKIYFLAQLFIGITFVCFYYNRKTNTTWRKYWPIRRFPWSGKLTGFKLRCRIDLKAEIGGNNVQKIVFSEDNIT